jgi:hypothetical protein
MRVGSTVATPPAKATREPLGKRSALWHGPGRRHRQVEGWATSRSRLPSISPARLVCHATMLQKTVARTPQSVVNLFNNHN